MLLWLNSSCYFDWKVHVNMTEQFVLPWLNSSCYRHWTVCVTVTEQFVLPWLNSLCYHDWTVHVTMTEHFMLLWLNSSCYCDWTVHVTMTEQFMQWLFVRESSGRTAVKEENVERIRRAFLRSPQKSILRCSLELGIPKSPVHTVLHKKLKLHVYKIQFLHEISATDKPMRNELAECKLETVDSEPSCMNNIMFTDEALFHVNGCINQPNCQIWGSEKPHVTHKFVHDSPKLNIRCELMHDHIFGLFTIVEKETINVMIFLDVLEFPPSQVHDLPNAGGFFFSFVCSFVHSFVWPCIVTNFFVLKPTRCTNFTNLFCHETLHVSDSSSAHHQEFIHCTLSSGICHTGL